MGLVFLIIFGIFWFCCSDKFEKGNANDTITLWGIMILIAIISAVLATCISNT